jgi:hypothetical protein
LIVPAWRSVFILCSHKAHSLHKIPAKPLSFISRHLRTMMPSEWSMPHG